jgi:MIP family channel proteins
MSDDLLRRSVAEAIGTFVLVFMGCGAVVANTIYNPGTGALGVCLAFAFSLVVMVTAIGHISGCHINPAVTVGLAAANKFPKAEIPFYIVAQAAGATAAALVLRAITGNIATLGSTVPGASSSASDAFLIEIVVTAIFVFVVSGAATDKRAPAAAAPLAIGGTILLLALAAGPISGGSVNPARSFGPALVSGTWDDFWIYITAPFIGGIIGALTYVFVQGPTSDVSAKVGTTAESQR